jgi:ferredoxin-NADP reductase
MSGHETMFTSLERACADVVVARVERPPGYEFRPGQWFRATIETDEGPQTRTFSHASAPGDEELEFATRLSPSAFKRALAQASPGDRVTVAGPGGRTFLPEGSRNVVFLTGGVGITPVRGIVRAAAREGDGYDDALIVYGNRDMTCAPYAEELASYRSSGVRLVSVFEDAPEGGDYELGRITAELLVRIGAQADGRPFFISGPPLMITAMAGVLDAFGVPEEDRVVEAFGSMPAASVG